MLEAQNLIKRYGERTVVDGMTLQLAAGEIVGLLGPNGAGKSTTVSMLCALTAPDSGRLVLDGQPLDLTRAGDRNRLKASIGLVPQELALYEDLSARHNLALFGALYGVPKTQLAARVSQALEQVGLADRAADRPGTFSGGMKRRLNLACALVHDPAIVLLDEPTVGVDPQSRNAIFDHLEALRRQGKALLYTTHYMEEAERLCDRVVIMDHGREVAHGTVTELVRGLATPASLEVGIATAVGAADREHLARLPAVRQVDSVPGGLHIGLAELSAAAPVLALLTQQGHRIERLHSQRAGLEEVFLALTGRQLRD